MVTTSPPAPPYLSAVPLHTFGLVPVDMARLARKLHHLRAANSESRANAAHRIGITEKQYNLWLGTNPPEIRPESVRKIAEGYNLPLGDLMNEVLTQDNGDLSLTDRLERLEADVAEILAVLREVVVPGVLADELERTARGSKRTGRTSGPTGRRQRQSEAS